MVLVVEMRVVVYYVWQTIGDYPVVMVEEYPHCPEHYQHIQQIK